MPEPVEEERELAERLVLMGVTYTLDPEKHITHVRMVTEPNEPGVENSSAQTLEILKRLKHLKTVDVRNITDHIPGSEFKKIAELEHLEEILVPGLESDGFKPRSLKGDDMKKFLENQPTSRSY